MHGARIRDSDPPPHLAEFVARTGLLTASLRFLNANILNNLLFIICACAVFMTNDNFLFFRTKSRRLWDVVPFTCLPAKRPMTSVETIIVSKCFKNDTKRR